MADLLGSIFGGGQRTDQSVKPDATAQAMNRQKLDQLQGLFSRMGLGDFADGGDAYRPSEGVGDLQNFARGNMRDTNDPRNDFTLQDYQAQGEERIDRGYRTASEATRAGYHTAAEGNRAARGQAVSGQNEALARGRIGAAESFGTGRVVNRQGYDTARAGARGAYDTGRAAARSTYDEGRGTVRAARDEGMAQAGKSGREALNVSDKAFERSRREALDQTSGYIAQVADPIAKQNAALQGLEGGGMVPAAIARATAEYGGNLLGPLLQQYMSGQQGIAGQQQATEGALSQQFAGSEAGLLDRLLAGEQGLASQYLGAESTLGSQYMGGEQALANQFLSGDQAMFQQFMNAMAGIDQTAMGAQAGLGQSYMGAEAAAGQQYAGNMANFAQSMPGAADVLGTMNARKNVMNAQAATGMMPLFDYDRQLKESDLLRRQGLAQTAFTGIPFTPGSSTNQRQSQQPLFNFFGQG